MPVQIGQAPSHGYSEPFGLLSDCHRRIERFLAMLARIAREDRGGALSPERAQALEVALKYFRDAAPKHTADEEESVFPRFLQAGGDPAELAALGEDHRRATLLHGEVDCLGRQWLDEGALTAPNRLIELLDDLASLYKDHIAYEDEHLFPLAARTIPIESQRLIGQEMAARRLR